MRGLASAAFELEFDPDLDGSIRAEWTILADAGMSSLGARTDGTNHPHVTLAHGPRSTVPFHPIPITLAEPTVFPSRIPGRSVLVRKVRRTADLDAVRDAVRDAGGTAVDGWQPHVTLAKRLAQRDLTHARRRLGGVLSGIATAVIHWDPATGSRVDVSA